MLEFTPIAESNIELDRIKEWGKLPVYHNNKPAFLKLLKPTVKPDADAIGSYLGIDKEEAETTYNYSNW